MREVTAAFTAMERTSEGIKEECYYGWVALQGYKLMENYLDLGFKLDLYSDYELEYINWYLSEIICHSIVKMYSYFQDVKKVILKSKFSIFDFVFLNQPIRYQEEAKRRSMHIYERHKLLSNKVFGVKSIFGCHPFIRTWRPNKNPKNVIRQYWW